VYCVVLHMMTKEVILHYYITHKYDNVKHSSLLFCITHDDKKFHYNITLVMLYCNEIVKIVCNVTLHTILTVTNTLAYCVV
jgi:hypothetical protein